MLTVNQIIQATNGALTKGCLETRATSVSIDSRNIKKGAIYVAIKGINHDGHTFIPDAIAKGAVAVIASRKVAAKGCAVVKVDDTTHALGKIAQYYRRQFDIPIIAITGSAGKTTTKNLIADVIGSQYKVLKNERSENNWIGLPLTLLKLRPQHEVAVIELGTNQFGDIAWLTAVSQPNIAVLTNIGESHLAGLVDKAGVLKEKLQLLKGLPKDGVLIYNQDDPLFYGLKRLKIPNKKIGFSIKNNADYRAVVKKAHKITESRFSVNQKLYVLNTPGQHQIYNALAAICCGELLNIRYKNVFQKLEKFKPDTNRGHIKKVGPYWICDDSYNANPLSLKSSLDVMKNFENKGRKVLVCADMLELGKESKNLHRLMAKEINRANIDLLLTLGSKAKWITSERTRLDPANQSFHCQTHGDIHRRLKKYCKKGDLILIKGSRAMQMEKTVNYIHNKLN